MSAGVLPLSQELRARTAQAHARLETRLDLLAEPLDRDRFRRVLRAFHAFHQAWEPAVAACAAGAWVAPRLALLEEDLAALDADGLSPPFTAAAALTSTAGRAWGSVYVMEGSALGGQVIGRALQQAAWSPAGGLRYFNPHGAKTGARWRAFRTVLDGEPDREGAAAGALATFEMLEAWVGAAAEGQGS